MGVTVGFNFGQWLSAYPEFTKRVNPTQAQNYFNLATQFHRNGGGGPVTDTTTQTNLLYLVTAHIAQLFAPASPGGTVPGRDPSVVGRITNASEGSVSVATEMPANPNAGWWNQTQYGTMYWQASAPYRTFRYIPGPRKPTNPWPIFGGFFGR